MCCSNNFVNNTDFSFFPSLVSDKKVCPEKHFRQACVEYQNIWFVIICRSENWYEAKAFCLELGGNLAILNTNEKRLAILTVIVERKLFRQCGWLYIGLVDCTQTRKKWCVNTFVNPCILLGLQTYSLIAHCITVKAFINI